VLTHTPTLQTLRAQLVEAKQEAAEARVALAAQLRVTVDSQLAQVDRTLATVQRDVRRKPLLPPTHG
jgi:hypothetical protein